MWQGTVDLYPVWGGTPGFEGTPPEGRLGYKGGNLITLSPQTISPHKRTRCGYDTAFGSKDVSDNLPATAVAKYSAVYHQTFYTTADL